MLDVAGIRKVRQIFQAFRPAFHFGLSLDGR